MGLSLPIVPYKFRVARGYPHSKADFRDCSEFHNKLVSHRGGSKWAQAAAGPYILMAAYASVFASHCQAGTAHFSRLTRTSSCLKYGTICGLNQQVRAEDPLNRVIPVLSVQIAFSISADR
jgi:hypothetical protein